MPPADHRTGWTEGVPTASGIYWLAGSCGGWPAVALYRVEGRHPSGDPQPFKDVPDGDVLAAAERYCQELRPFYTRIDQEAIKGSFEAPWEATHYLRVEEPKHPSEPAPPKPLVAGLVLGCFCPPDEPRTLDSCHRLGLCLEQGWREKT